MKKISLLIAILAIYGNTYSQKDYSGEYVNNTKTHAKDLVLFRIDSTHYKFWVAAFSKNYVDYGDGIMELKNNTGICKY